MDVVRYGRYDDRYGTHDLPTPTDLMVQFSLSSEEYGRMCDSPPADTHIPLAPPSSVDLLLGRNALPAHAFVVRTRGTA